MEEGQPKEIAEQIATNTIQRDHWYTITPGQVDGYRMFSVRGAGGVLNVRLNTTATRASVRQPTFSQFTSPGLNYYGVSSSSSVGAGVAVFVNGTLSMPSIP